MALTTITIDVDESKLSAIDQLAEQMHLDRSSLLNQALGSYLALKDYKLAQIEESIRELDAGKGIPHAEVVREIEARMAARAAARMSEA